MNENFSDRLIKKIIEKNNPSVAGIDPRLDLFPESFIEEIKKEYDSDWELQAIRKYIIEIINITEKVIGVFKPQIAYFEQFGGQGLNVLKEIIDLIKKKESLVILDAKRNDIGSTSEAYAKAFLDPRNKYGFNVDALTINPYLGSDSVSPFLNYCNSKYGKGLFILVKTSNPSGREIQDVRIAPHNKLLYELIGEKVKEWGNDFIGENGFSSIGAVVGATYPEQAKVLRKIMPNSYFLVPGYGAQGGTAKDIIPNFNEKGLGAIINSSRKIMYAYRYYDEFSPEEFREATKFSVEKMKDEINSALTDR